MQEWEEETLVAMRAKREGAVPASSSCLPVARRSSRLEDLFARTEQAEDYREQQEVLSVTSEDIEEERERRRSRRADVCHDGGASEKSETSANASADARSEESTVLVRSWAALVRPGNALVPYQVRRPNQMKTYAFGHDFGNSGISGVLLRGLEQKKATIPTAFTRIDVDAMANLGGVDVAEQRGAKFPESLQTLAVQLAKDSTTYALGELALAQGVDVWTGRKDAERYATSYSVRALCALSGSMIGDREYGLHVVTGLPADIFMRHPHLRKEIKTALDGDHGFSLDNGRTWRMAHVEVATVVMEGAGALIAYGGAKGPKPGERPVGERAVIDIGGGTTDLYAESKGGVPMTDFCRNSHLAVEAATDLMAASLRKKYRPLTALEARDILHAHIAESKKKQYPVLASFGTAITPEDMALGCSQAINQVAEDIASFVSSAWGAAGRFDPILLIGGGYYYFYQALKKRIPHLSYPDDPVHANAIGYATLAARFLHRKQSEARAS
jgi:plasmid segregation protein ParM